MGNHGYGYSSLFYLNSSINLILKENEKNVAFVTVFLIKSNIFNRFLKRNPLHVEIWSFSLFGCFQTIV